MTDVRNRMRPELRAALDEIEARLPAGYHEMSVDDRRAWGAEQSVLFTGPETPTSVSWRHGVVARAADGSGIPVRIYEPAAHAGTSPRPAVLYLHGGGMWGGGIESEHPLALRFCELVGAVVVTVEYRLAPENPYPAGLDDCVEVLGWMAAGGVACDPERIAVYGASAGGGLAIATALRAREEQGPGICLVVAVQPMIDDRHETPSAREFSDLGPAFYDRRASQESWGFYMSGREADHFAAPARADDLSGLPPMYIDVGELDLFRDEDVDFARRLAAAHVPTELHVFPAAIHGFENLAPELDISRAAIEQRAAAFRRAFAQKDQT